MPGVDVPTDQIETEDSPSQAETDRPEPDAGLRFEGYEVLSDTKVSLNPVPLMPRKSR
jgi:hypothetical protein